MEESDGRRTLGGLPLPLLGGASPAAAVPAPDEGPAVVLAAAAASAWRVFLFLLPGGRPLLRFGAGSGAEAVSRTGKEKDGQQGGGGEGAFQERHRCTKLEGDRRYTPASGSPCVSSSSSCGLSSRSSCSGEDMVVLAEEEG